jgi:hypothetical protein
MFLQTNFIRLLCLMAIDNGAQKESYSITDIDVLSSTVDCGPFKMDM